jgi:hypothetical protein
VIRHRLGVPKHEHPYFDDVDMHDCGAHGLRNAFLGSIRWPKSVGRVSGSLAGGLSFTLKNHFKVRKTGAGGEDMSEEGA